MTRLLFIFLAIAFGFQVFAQNKMNIHTASGQQQYSITESDSMFFDADNDLVFFRINESLMEFSVSEIDSITFDVVTDSTIYIDYQGNSVSVINPLADLGVEIAVSGADVTVVSTATIKDINYVLSGTTSEGYFKIYSDLRFNLLMNGVNITNTDGPAINIQSNKKARVNLVAGTINILTDGETYAASSEDQSAAFFSEGDLVFIGSGSLTVNGFGDDQNGIRSDDEVEVNEGNITISSAVKDGIHGKNGFRMNGGEVNISSQGDGIDGSEGHIVMNNGTLTVNSTADDVKAMKCDSTITINGGFLDFLVAGDQSNGIKCDMEMFLVGGEINIEVIGGVVLEASGSGYDPSYSGAIKGESDIYIQGSTIHLITTGEASRGISSDSNIIVESGTITIVSSGDGDTYANTDGDNDAYHGACFKTDAGLSLLGGSVTISNSGSGGKGLAIDGSLIVGDGSSNPQIDITTTGERITISQGGGGGSSGDYDESKAIKADVSVTINSGVIEISSADDGIKAEESITLNHGYVTVSQSTEGLESPNITVNGGTHHVFASDDAVNATHGNGGENDDGSLFLVNDGYLHLSATGGDALDSNGDFTISGGSLVVHGPQSSPEVGMDVNGQSIATGGFLVVSGTNSNMTYGMSNGSTQRSVLFRSNSSNNANVLFHIQDSNGNNVLTFAPARRYYSVVFSSSLLQAGQTYSVYTGGTCTGTVTDGVYTGGTYSGGTFKTTFTPSNMTMTVWY